MSTITITTTGLREASAWLSAFKVTNAIVRASDLSTPLITEALRQEAPYRPSSDPGHRHLRDSIRTTRHTTIGGTARQWTSDVPQANFVLDGTRAHSIDPVSRTVLSWLDEQSGDRVFARHVDHPGSKPNPFNRRAWDRVGPAVVGYYRRELAKEMHP